MSELQKEILNQLKRVIREWNDKDIYAISFLIGENAANPGKPTLTVGYNTESCYLEAIPYAKSEEEARWDYSFWLQNSEAEWGYTEESIALIAEWLKETGLDQYKGEDFFVGYKFIEELSGVAKALHIDGDIKQVFGKDIPILMHDFEFCYKTVKENDVKDKKKDDTDAILDIFRALK